MNIIISTLQIHNSNYREPGEKKSYQLVSGYKNVKAYIRGDAPDSVRNKQVVSGYVKSNGKKVKAYTRKKK